MESSEVPEAANVLRHPLDHRHHAITVLVGANRLVAVAPEFLDNRASRSCNRLEVIAAFERGDHFVVAAFRGKPRHASSHRGETIFSHPHLSERIAEMAIETGGDEDELWLEVTADRHDQTIEGAEIFAVAELRRHRHVDCVSGSRSVADLMERAGAGVVRKLMDGGVEHLGRFVEHFLRTVAVMHIPIDYHNALQTAHFD